MSKQTPKPTTCPGQQVLKAVRRVKQVFKIQYKCKIEDN